MNLHNYDLIIINSSGGKDSLAAKYEVCRLADLQGFQRENIVVSHQDLKRSEWPGVQDLVKRQAQLFDLDLHVTRYRDLKHRELDLLQYVRRRGKWPSQKNRWCTSDYKRTPGGRVITLLSKDLAECKVLYVFGYRKEESPARRKRPKFSKNRRFSTKTREVFNWYPIHNWTEKKVWKTIKENALPYHWAYDQGMPRLSCVFCIFAPFDALCIAGKHNPELLEEYVAAEAEISHSFKEAESMASVKAAINNGYQPVKAENWTM